MNNHNLFTRLEHISNSRVRNNKHTRFIPVNPDDPFEQTRQNQSQQKGMRHYALAHAQLVREDVHGG